MGCLVVTCGLLGMQNQITEVVDGLQKQLSSNSIIAPYTSSNSGKVGDLTMKK